MAAVRSQVLEVIRDAYPETFEGLAASKPLGENIFSGPTPHPNEVLNFFIRQNLTSALPMAYYMATRRGLSSLMDRHLPRSATLSPEILQSAIGGLMALREVEFEETHDLVFGKDSCFTKGCPSRYPTTFRKALDRIMGSPRPGTEVLEVPKFFEDCGGGVPRVDPGVCSGCLRGWCSGHAELRERVWAMLPGVFGLGG